MADTPIGPGSVLAGRFVLEDLLDESEGARFWRATDRILARDVAVHVLASTDPRAAGLLSAARTSATVTDGHLLRVLDAAAEDGVTYVVNEWGHGISLDKLLAEGPLSARRAAWVVKEVAEAISTAHRHGIAHGRLLPENVMISESGSVKLIGFVVDAVLRGRGATRVTGGDPLGEHEADVVNLGALLYAGLVGRWPGTEGSTVPVAPAEHGRPLRPRQVRAGVPRPLDAICERVLGTAHSHAVPIETAHEIYAALSDYVGDPTVTPSLGEPTSMFDAGELRDAGGRLDGEADRQTEGETDEATGEQTQLSPGPTATPAASAAASGPDSSDLPATQMVAAPGQGGTGHDPESTQVGAPVFDDPGFDDHGPGGFAGDEPTRAVPPPPTLAQPEPRPLFASDTPRPARVDSDLPRSTGAGNGAIPAVWGPDADTPPPASRRPRDDDYDEPPGRSWLRLAAAVAGVLVLVLAIVFAFNLGRDSILPEEEDATPPASAEGPPQDTPEPVDIAGVTDLDPPPGNGSENPETAGQAIDGDPATTWTTLTYQGVPELGNLKPGVGLMVDLGEPVDVADVQLTLLGDGTDVTLFAAPDAQAAPTATAQMQRVAREVGAGTEVTLAPRQPVSTQFLLVWLTRLPPYADGYRGEVAEIVVRS